MVLSPGQPIDGPGPASFCSRKTLVYLILTLNHIYPDYDFTLLRAQNFCKEEGLATIRELVTTHLVEAAKACGGGREGGGGVAPRLQAV